MDGFVNQMNSLYGVIQGIALMAGTLRCIFILQKARSDDKPLTTAFDQCKKIVIVIILICSMQELVNIFSNTLGMINTAGELKARIIQLCESVVNVIIKIITLPITVFGFIKELLLGIWNPEERDAHFKKASKKLAIGIAIITIYTLLKTIVYNYFHI